MHSRSSALTLTLRGLSESTTNLTHQLWTHLCSRIRTPRSAHHRHCDDPAPVELWSTQGWAPLACINLVYKQFFLPLVFPEFLSVHLLPLLFIFPSWPFTTVISRRNSTPSNWQNIRYNNGMQHGQGNNPMKNLPEKRNPQAKARALSAVVSKTHSRKVTCSQLSVIERVAYPEATQVCMLSTLDAYQRVEPVAIIQNEFSPNIFRSSAFL